MSKERWLLRPTTNQGLKGKIKLICFPYAGGSAATYLDWKEWLPKDVDLIAIQPPGRASRMFEPAYKNMHDLIQTLMPILSEELLEPYIFFGHSLGSRVAFECMKFCEENSLNLPNHFIASGSRGPHLPPRITSIYQLDDSKFIDKLKVLNGTPKEILNNAELMELCLPLLRADFELADKYQFSGNNNFNCPATIFGGRNDSHIGQDELSGWQRFFTPQIDIKTFDGGHFFVDSSKRAVLKTVSQIITKELEKLKVTL